MKELDTIKWEKLLTSVKDYIKFRESKDYNEDGEMDWAHEIFDEVLEVVYGEKVFDYLNSLVD